MAKKEFQRHTIQRATIYQTLLKDKSHPRAQELYKKVRRRIPHISFATVYRTLNLLKEQGLVRELAMGDAASYWDGNCSPHYHFFCQGCKRLMDLPVMVHTNWDKELERKTGLKVFNHSLEFYGLCGRCQDIRK